MSLLVLRPRALVWRGVVRATGFWFASDLLSEAEIRRRILALWCPGVRVERFPEGCLVRLSEPVKVVAERAPGLPLVEQHGVLLSAPLSDKQFRELAPPRGVAVLVRGGSAEMLPAGTPEDPAFWISTGSWELITPTPLGQVPLPADLLPSAEADARAQLGIPAADEEFAEMLRSLKAAGTGQGRLQPTGAGLAAGIIGLAGAMLSRLGSLADAPPALLPFLRVLLAFMIIRVFALLFGAASSTGPGFWLFLLVAVGLTGLAVLAMNAAARSGLPKTGGRANGSPGRVRVPVTLAKFWGLLAVFALSTLCVSFLWVVLTTMRDNLGVLLFFVLLIVAIYLVSISGFFGVPVQLPGGGGVDIVSSVSAHKTGIARKPGGLRLGKGAEGLLRGLRRMLAHFGTRAATGSGNGPATRESSRPVPSSGGQPAKPRLSPWQKLSDALARSLLFSQLGAALTRRQRQYLQKMMEMFDKGNWDEALRHAIPLGGGTGETPLSFGLPGRRASLDIQAGQTPASSSMFMGGLEDRLREMYRRAFERLRDSRRFKEAAYVLAELLNANEEAVSFLEQHGEKRLAAEMAEARGLAPGLVVRQWFVAGDRERAVRYARLHGAFEDAVMRLEREKLTNEAAALRLLWSQALAEAGDFENAFLKSHGMEAATALSREWLRLGIEAGGLPAARLMAHQLRLPGVTWEQARGPILELLEDEAADKARERSEFALQITNEMGDSGRMAARAALRACYRDIQQGLIPADRLPSQLVRQANDAALRADAPQTYDIKAPEFPSGGQVEFRYEVTDRGALQVFDAAPLPDGSCLVALGELGVRWLGRDGRIKAHFDQPAHALVPSHTGGAAILLARRGEALRMARLDLARRTARFWHETIFGPWASSYDGSLWFAAMGGRIVALDAQAPEFGKLWDSGPLPGPVARIHWNPVPLANGDWTPGKPAWITALIEAPLPHAAETTGIDDPVRFEMWHIAQPELVLRGRPSLPIKRQGLQALALTDTRGIGQEFAMATLEVQRVEIPGEAEPRLVPYFCQASVSVEFDAEVLAGKPLAITAHRHQWAVLTVAYAHGVTCYLVDSATGTVRGRFNFEGAGSCRARFAQETLLLADDCGRVVTFDLKSGLVTREWRVR